MSMKLYFKLPRELSHTAYSILTNYGGLPTSVSLTSQWRCTTGLSASFPFIRPRAGPTPNFLGRIGLACNVRLASNPSVVDVCCCLLVGRDMLSEETEGKRE